MFVRLASCVALCASIVVTLSVGAQSDTEAMLILNQNATDAGESQLILLSGPNDATIKALDELETRTVLMPPGPDDMLPVSATAVISINSAGSYVLGGNLFGVAGKHGIEIKKSNVTLDLNGYAVIGTTNSLSGINLPSGVVNVKIHNGAIRGWPRRGIDAKKASASEVSDVRVGNCKWHGIYLGQGIVSGCISRNNKGDGINIEYGNSVVQNCTAELNGGHGISCGSTCIVTGCVAAENGEDGITGRLECAVIDCTAKNNLSMGINLSSGGVVRGCTSDTNSSTGIRVTTAGAVSECVSRDNGDSGIETGSYTRIAGCTVYSNNDVGILAGNACIVESCTSSGNDVGGIKANAGSLVSGCSVSLHTASDFYGIHVLSDSQIIGNTCDGNSIGILVISSDNRIDGNNVADGSVGIRVSVAASVIVRNTVSCLTDFDIAAGNKVGATSTNPATAGPWDNFDF